MTIDMDRPIPIPAPRPREQYVPPTFSTFQDRQRAKEARLRAAADVYIPPTPPTRSSSSRILPQPPSPPRVDDSIELQQRHVRPPQHHVQPPQHPAIHAHLERSDTLASVRSLDRSSFSARKPLPKPPVVVNSSKSLDRGLPARRKPSMDDEDRLPSVVVVPTIIEESSAVSTPIVTPPTIHVPVGPPSIVIEGVEDTEPISSAPAFIVSAPPTISVSSEPELVHPGSAIVCDGCANPIIGRIVNATGTSASALGSAQQRRFHPGCFACSECGELLEHVSSYEWEGRAYCHLDYHDKFAHHCYHCKTPIVDPRFVTLNDDLLGQRYYHELHFFCSECGDPFLDPTRAGDAEETNAFTIHRGHPYCESCHLRLHKPKCKGCRQPIPNVAIDALGGKWHQGCFRCSTCRKGLDTIFFPLDGQALCTECFELGQ